MLIEIHTTVVFEMKKGTAKVPTLGPAAAMSTLVHL